MLLRIGRVFRADITNHMVSWKKFSTTICCIRKEHRLYRLRFYSNMNRSIAIILGVCIANYAPRYYVYITKGKEIACKPFKSYLIGAIIGSSMDGWDINILPGDQYNALCSYLGQHVNCFFNFCFFFCCRCSSLLKGRTSKSKQFGNSIQRTSSI